MMSLEPRPYERRIKNSILIDHAMELHKGPTNCVIQAGGHVGVWPNRLVEYFDNVYTFEPHPGNYDELKKNTEWSDKIQAFNWALGNSVGATGLKFSTKSSGMHYISDDSNGGVIVGIISIDLVCHSMNIIPDAIFLDIEGYEMNALLGAHNTIKNHLPLIVCEENDAGERYGVKIGGLSNRLAEYGYKMKRKYKKDLIFCPS